VAGSSEHCNESSAAIESGGLIEQLSDCLLIKEDSAQGLVGASIAVLQTSGLISKFTMVGSYSVSALRFLELSVR
jgi:hypothetical protein